MGCFCDISCVMSLLPINVTIFNISFLITFCLFTVRLRIQDPRLVLLCLQLFSREEEEVELRARWRFQLF